MLLTLRGMFINYFSDTRELNTVAAKPYPLKTPQTPLYAVGVALAAVGAYLRVSGPQGRLRACTRQLTAAPPTAMKKSNFAFTLVQLFQQGTVQRLLFGKETFQFIDIVRK